MKLHLINILEPNKVIQGEFAETFDGYFHEFSFSAAFVQKYWCGFCSTDKKIIQAIEDELFMSEMDDFEFDSFDEMDLDEDDIDYSILSINTNQEMKIGMLLKTEIGFVTVSFKTFHLLNIIVNEIFPDNEEIDIFESFSKVNGGIFNRTPMYERKNNCRIFDMDRLFNEMKPIFFKADVNRRYKTTSPRIANLGEWFRRLVQWSYIKMCPTEQIDNIAKLKAWWCYNDEKIKEKLEEM